MKIGVLGLQGDVREHVHALDAVGVSPVVVKRPGEIDSVQALIVPGGESTTIGKLLERFGLLDEIRQRASEGMPVYGTCAGLILLAQTIEGPDEAPHRFGLMEVAVRRNAYGRQVDSFEADLPVTGLERPFPGVFIRAPVIEKAGESVEVLASWDGRPVLVRQGHLLGSSFHPEISGDTRIHEMFVEMARG